MSTAPQSTAPVPPQQAPFIYYSCLAVTIAAPLVAALPPRRLNPQTFALGIAWCAATGAVLEAHTGHGLLWHVGSRLPSAQPSLAEEARRRQRQQQQQLQHQQQTRDEAVPAPAQRGVVKRIWMGREGDDWVERRAAEERAALDEGRGYGGLIVDYVMEAVGARRSNGDDQHDSEEDEEATRRASKEQNDKVRKE